ncbi:MULTISPECIES: hypothetical protein [unclassified Sinorhizobium]|uniref:hypothetical protein n=1 Tax=unclassified Sinorhizobium TaxID=2613772 RepID=UPI003525227B
MIFITATMIGIAAGLIRSAFSVAMIAALIGLSFVVAAIASPGPVHILSLLLAVGGYNAGLFTFLATLMIIDRLKTA